MTTKDGKLYLADSGKVFQRKSDGFIMGWGISLGVNDSIDNYEEVDNPDPENPKYNRELRRNARQKEIETRNLRRSDRRSIRMSRLSRNGNETDNIL